MADPAMANLGNFGVYTPVEAIELVSRAGVKKGNMRSDKIFASAVSAGCLLSFAAAAALRVTTAPWAQEHAPGPVAMIAGIVFHLG